MWIAIATNDEKLTHFANFHNWKIISKYLRHQGLPRHRITILTVFPRSSSGCCISNDAALE